MNADKYPRNPYIAGDPVGNTSAFIGREYILNKASSCLKSSQTSAISIFGQRRIGKTSVLQNIRRRLDSDKSFLPVFLDLEDKSSWELKKINQSIACEIFEGHDIDIDENNLTDPYYFVSYLLPSALKALNKKSIIFLFDEFDVLNQDGMSSTVKDFYDFIKLLLKCDPNFCKVVIAAGRNLDDLSSSEIALYRSSYRISISTLHPSETQNLVLLSERNGTLKWTSSAVKRVYQLTAGHPYLTQQLCSHIWEEKYDSNEGGGQKIVSIEDVDKSADDSIESSLHALDWVWQALPATEQLLCSAVAEIDHPKRKKNHTSKKIISPIINWMKRAKSSIIKNTVQNQLKCIVSQEKLDAFFLDKGIIHISDQLSAAEKNLSNWGMFVNDGDYVGFQVFLIKEWVRIYHPFSRVIMKMDSIDPRADGLYKYGKAHFENKNYHDAEEYLRQALEINPNHIAATLLLADVISTDKRNEEAIFLLEKILPIASRHAKPRLLSALLDLAKQKESEIEKISIYNKILTIEPDHKEAIIEYTALEKKRVEAERKIEQRNEALKQREIKLEREKEIIERRLDNLTFEEREIGIIRLVLYIVLIVIIAIYVRFCTP